MLGKALVLCVHFNVLAGALPQPPPMVVVPGLTSSIVEYQLVNAEPYKNCPTSTSGQWQMLFPADENMTFAETLCWVENFAVTFNTTTQMFQARRRGVLTRTIGFGDFTGFPSLNFLIPFWQGMGWTVGQDLFGAPFDWRYATSGRPDTFFPDLQALVEKAYNLNNKTKVVIMAPSFGPQYVLGFLHRMTQSWKDQYVSWFIAVSPVFGGAVMSLEYYLSGLDGVPPIFAGLSRREIDSTGIAAWMFPRAGTNATVEWTKDEPLAITPTRNYSAFDTLDMYTALGLPDIDALKFVTQEPDLGEFAHPGVNTFVTYGYGVPTPGPFTYSAPFKSGVVPPYPSNETISGDDIVPLRSSLRGLKWANDMKQAEKTLYYKGYWNQSHAMCLAPPGYIPGLADDGCYRELYGLIINGTAPTNLLAL